MRKIPWTCIIVACLTLACVFEFSDIKAAHRAAIARVLSERVRFRQIRPRLLPMAYRNAMAGIDASNCPADFRQAWSEYVLAWDAHIKGSRDPITGLAEVALAARTGSSAIADDALSNLRVVDPTIAFNKVQRIALERYNIPLPQE